MRQGPVPSESDEVPKTWLRLPHAKHAEDAFGVPHRDLDMRLVSEECTGIYRDAFWERTSDRVVGLIALVIIQSVKVIDHDTVEVAQQIIIVGEVRLLVYRELNSE